MTPAYISGAIKKITDLRGDPEAAHCAEDELHREVLKAVANGECKEPQSCAALALTTEYIKFPRWCA